jgi:hypothetical protein
VIGEAPITAREARALPGGLPPGSAARSLGR